MATIEALHDMKLAGLMSAADEDRYVQALDYTEPLHQQVADFLRRVLKLAQSDPDAALSELTAARTHPERIFRIAVQRLAPRLLATRPGPALDLLAYFLRRGDDDQPLEHQNLRRPVSRALPDIFTALEQAPELEERIDMMLQLLAQDPDIHVRRALGDALDRLATINQRLTHTVLKIFSQDEDPYIQQRALRTLLNTPDEGLTSENGGQANG
jgi:3-methyladenine DNA glycosylase AlkC